MIVLSHYQAAELLAGRRAGSATVTASPDLGMSRVEASLGADGVRFADGGFVEWATLQKIAKKETNCFVIDDGGCRKLLAYSEATKRPFGLLPTPRAPALLLSGVTMHRIKNVDPVEDTERKIRAVSPLTGRVLDTATGLGYTAIAAARTASHVTTIELDAEVLELARLNPWSCELFDNSKITQVVGDSSQLVRTFSDLAFDHILHDPPMIRLAGDLYSTVLYREFFRVLRPGGRLFHYIGDPESPGGHTTTQGVLRRLRETGFHVEPRPEAFGVVARK